MPRPGWKGRALLALAAAVCSCFEVEGPPPDTGIPAAPSQPAPTGTRWEGKEVIDGCGRKTIAWTLADEICAGTDRPDYLASLRVPMFRDGALIGDRLFTVDATHLWVLDVAQPSQVKRQALVAGLGQPLAVQSIDKRLVVASGAEGVVLLDVTDPLAPRRTGALALPGPALDLHLDGEVAYVAMGKAGVAMVDVKGATPALVRTLPLEGLPKAHAAGVTARDGRVYVAACSTFAVLDAASGSLLGHTWRTDAERDGILVAPAKDVELVGDVAFVAAGRFGAVAVNVKDPSNPTLLGNCTEAADLSFYASGVRASAGSLYVAGGEWGVKAIPVSNPAASCTLTVSPQMPGTSVEGESDCSARPPWTVMPWEQLWTPPPPGKDPIQVLPAADRVYALGDARRVGTRAVDIRDGSSLDLMGRYDEPRLYLGVAAAKGTVVTWGPGAGVFQRDEGKLLVPRSAPPAAAAATAGAVLPDGRWAFLSGERLYVEGVTQPLPLPQGALPHALAVRSGQAIVPTSLGVVLIDLGAGTASAIFSGRTAALPPSLAASETAIYTAAPEWTSARAASGAGLEWSDLAAHGVFDESQILDLNLWRIALPRRHLAPTPAGVAELATLGGAAGLVIHPGTRSLALPPATYSGMASAPGRLYLTAVDRGTYESRLLSVDISCAEPQILSTESFTGIATGVAADGDRLYVSDADRGIHVYRLAANTAPTRLGTVASEVKP